MSHVTNTEQKSRKTLRNLLSPILIVPRIQYIVMQTRDLIMFS